MPSLKRFIRSMKEVLRKFDELTVVGQLYRNTTPHVLLKHLKRGDIVSFRLGGSTVVSVKVVDPGKQLVIPCQWHFMKGPMQIRQVAISVGHSTRFGHPKSGATYIDLGPAWQILVNGLPIVFPPKGP